MEDAGGAGSESWAARWRAGETPPTTRQRLRTQVRAWPTARAQDGRHAAPTHWESAHRPPDYALHTAVNWPTPQARDGAHNAGREWNLPTAVPGVLNPDWVCLLMGLPPNWLDVGKD